MVGHLHAAAKARLLGYDIRPDGRKGRGRQWAVVGVAEAFVSGSPSAATRSPGTWPRAATSATGPSASPPGRPGHLNVGPVGMNCSRNERQRWRLPGCQQTTTRLPSPPQCCRNRASCRITDDDIDAVAAEVLAARKGRAAASGDRRPAHDRSLAVGLSPPLDVNARSPSGDGRCPPGARAGVQGVWPSVLDRSRRRKRRSKRSASRSADRRHRPRPGRRRRLGRHPARTCQPQHSSASPSCRGRPRARCRGDSHHPVGVR